MKYAKIEDGCIGCGLCQSVCPSVFRITDRGLAEVYGEITGENEADAYEAENGCPVGVISITED